VRRAWKRGGTKGLFKERRGGGSAKRQLLEGGNDSWNGPSARSQGIVEVGKNLYTAARGSQRTTNLFRERETTPLGRDSGKGDAENIREPLKEGKGKGTLGRPA